MEVLELPLEMREEIMRWLTPGAMANWARVNREMAAYVKEQRGKLMKRYAKPGLSAGREKTRCFEKLPNGKKHGEERTYTNGGVLTRRAWWWYGELHGREETYREGKVTRMRTWNRGERQGPMVYYHPNGKMRSLVMLCNGKYHGKYVAWNERGEREMEGEYREGRPTGEFIYYQGGQVKKRCRWTA